MCQESRKVNVVLVHVVQKNILFRSSLSSVVCAVCLHICETYSTVWHVRQFVYFFLSVCVCVYCLRFSNPSAICLFPIHPFPASSPGSSSAVVIGNVLSGRQSCVAPCPSWCSPTTPSTLQRVSLSRLPLRGVSPEGASVLSEPLNVPVFLAEDGDLVLKQDRVQSHLWVDQRHGAKPAGELVHAGLSLGKVVWIGPARSPWRLLEKRKKSRKEDKRTVLESCQCNE